jgi:peptidoglycan/xylan/chitin deacetylase (PgdA/CDA1 family)
VSAPHANPAVRAIKAARGFALRMAATHLVPDQVMLLRGPRGRRRIALTFDDGPHALTAKYLAVLARAGVRATFFVVGRACLEHPGSLSDIVGAGHEVAGHGFTHTEFPLLEERELRRELDRTAALLPPPKTRRALVRPPRGVVTPRSLLACFRAGYTSAMWSLDTLDWDASSADDIVRRVPTSRVGPGEIILMHEGRTATLEALPRVIADLQGAHFELVSVSELIAERAS